MSKISYKAQKSSKTSKKIWEALEEITGLSNGVFGLRNRIFGKFFVLFYLTTFGNTSNLNIILGNSMISASIFFAWYILRSHCFWAQKFQNLRSFVSWTADVRTFFLACNLNVSKYSVSIMTQSPTESTQQA